MKWSTEIKEPYLQVTFRRGKPLAAYYTLPRRIGAKSHRTRRVEPGFIIDFDRRGTPIGIEITAPSKTTVTAFNRLLKELGMTPVNRDELAPLHAA